MHGQSIHYTDPIAVLEKLISKIIKKCRWLRPGFFSKDFFAIRIPCSLNVRTQERESKATERRYPVYVWLGRHGDIDRTADDGVFMLCINNRNVDIQPINFQGDTPSRRTSFWCWPSWPEQRPPTSASGHWLVLSISVWVMFLRTLLRKILLL